MTRRKRVFHTVFRRRMPLKPPSILAETHWTWTSGSSRFSSSELQAARRMDDRLQSMIDSASCGFMLTAQVYV